MTEYKDIVGHPDEPSKKHREKSNPLNSRTQTAKWIRSTIQTGVRESELEGSEVIKVVENAVKETESSGGDQTG
jgi:hypothetical protein